MPKEKTLEKLISEYSGLDISITDSGNEAGFLEDLRRIGGTFPKSNEQKEQEKELRGKMAIRQKLKNEIACRLGFSQVALMSEFDFYKFVLVNFQVKGNQIKQRKEIILPSEITTGMLREAAKEADRRSGRYVAPEK